MFCSALSIRRWGRRQNIELANSHVSLGSSVWRPQQPMGLGVDSHILGPPDMRRRDVELSVAGTASGGGCFARKRHAADPSVNRVVGRQAGVTPHTILVYLQNRAKPCCHLANKIEGKHLYHSIAIF